MWLCFIILCPKRWAALVDKENNFWVGKGFISAARAEQIKMLEKGMTVKVMVGLLVALTTFLLFTSIRTQERIHPKRKGPILPTLRLQAQQPNGGTNLHRKK